MFIKNMHAVIKYLTVSIKYNNDYFKTTKECQLSKQKKKNNVVSTSMSSKNE